MLMRPGTHHILKQLKVNDENGDTIYTTGVLEYTNSSEPVVLPLGNYTIVNTNYEATEGTISVTNENLTAILW